MLRRTVTNSFPEVIAVYHLSTGPFCITFLTEGVQYFDAENPRQAPRSHDEVGSLAGIPQHLLHLMVSLLTPLDKGLGYFTMISSKQSAGLRRFG